MSVISRLRCVIYSLNNTIHRQYRFPNGQDSICLAEIIGKHVLNIHLVFSCSFFYSNLLIRSESYLNWISQNILYRSLWTRVQWNVTVCKIKQNQSVFLSHNQIGNTGTGTITICYSIRKSLEIHKLNVCPRLNVIRILMSRRMRDALSVDTLPG